MYFTTGAQLQAAIDALPASKKGSFVSFDPFFYGQQYMTGYNGDLSPIEHFVQIGAARGYQPSATFDPAYYQSLFADLQGKGFDSADLLYHFLQYGLDEGRVPNATLAGFDGAAYLAAYPDVAAYVEANLDQFGGSASNGALAHYVKFGAAEGRLATGSLAGGETFALTTGVDNIAGTAGNDTILGSNDVNGTGDITFNIGDVVNGGAGVDTLVVANDHDSLTLNARTVIGVENFKVVNGDSSFDTLNLNNKSFETVTIDFAGTENSDYLNVDGINADTDLVWENMVADGYYNSRNDAGVYSTLQGSVTQNNTVTNLDYSVNDTYAYFYNYAYFSAATELNLTNTLDNLITGGTTSTGSDEWFGFYDYIEMEADNATINVTYNFIDALQPDNYNEFEAYIYNGSTADVADVVNATINAENVDGLYGEIDADYSGTDSDEDTVTVNANGVLNTDDSNWLGFDDFETININVNADSDLGYVDANSNVTAAQTINIVANANLEMTSGEFDEADEQEVTVNISGAGDVTIDFYGDNYGFTLNGGTATGNLDLTVGSDATYALEVTTGSGDDTITLDNAFELNTDADAFLQVIDGGDGTDTFEITAANIVTSQALLNADVTDFSDAIKNFERLSLTAYTTQDIDATTLGFDHVTIDGYTTGGSLTIANEGTVVVTGAGTTDYAVVVDGADTGTADSLNLTVNGADGITLALLTVADVETINLVSSASAADDTTPGDNNVALIAADTVTLNISGATALDLDETGTDLSAVETVDAAGFDAGLTITLATADQAIEITTGAGADVVVGSAYNDIISVGNGGNTVTGGLGLDTITLGSGATADDVDTIVIGAVADSQGVAVDVVNGFQVEVQATTDTNGDDVVDADDIINDVIDLSAIVFTGTASYKGEAAGYGAVLTSLDGVHSYAVLDTTTNTVYVDVNADGSLTNADIAIKLTGVTDLSADNFVFPAPV